MVKRFNSLEEASEVISALNAPMRMRIMELLYENEERSLDEIAKILGLTNSAVTLHINKLKLAGLIDIVIKPGKRGSKKICKPLYREITINMDSSKIDSIKNENFYENNIPIGYYNRCEVEPTCGIASKNHVIGSFDSPKYFSFPEHFESGIFWFGVGYIEYDLPNRLFEWQCLKKLEISFEISSECEGYNEDYPSDIYFYINHIELGYFTSPGDYGKRKGKLTPSWWPDNCNQYGLLKTLTISENGTFIDNIKISNVDIDNLKLDANSLITFRLEVKKESKNCGGLTLFGKDFGDYNQDICVRTFYEACTPGRF